MTTPHICFDKILPRDLTKAQPFQAMGRRTRAISPLGKLWINGSTLRVGFLGGTPDQKSFVVQHAAQWMDHANLNFDFGDYADGDIRVTFDPNDGAWSYVGTDAKSIPLGQATLNLGWLDQAVVLHEFGHAIGLAHEHQNPEGGIVWNEAAVIRDLSGPPNYWDEATIRHNVLNKYYHDQINGTEFDPESIMLYAFPAEWTNGVLQTRENTDLSDLDKAFVAGEKMYPGRTGTDPEFTELPVFAPTSTQASIGKPGEEDRYVFKVETMGTYVVETTGSTDVVMKLYGPDSWTQLITEDDDSGRGYNSKIASNLAPGKYYVQIRHYNTAKGTGNYGISVVKA